MNIRHVAILLLALNLTGCGRKESAVATPPAKAEKGVSIESQSTTPDAPPPSTPPAPNQPAPAVETAPPADSGDPTSSDAKKRYTRNMAWVQELKFGDEKKKQEIAGIIKRANLSASERAEFEQLKAHYNVQYVIQY